MNFVSGQQSAEQMRRSSQRDVDSTPGGNDGIHVLQCMEIWSGHRSVENRAASTGLEAWIFSKPYRGESNGGDVYYLSLCVGGIVTRLLLADVSGHGSRVAHTSAALRSLLRQYMNTKKQDRLVAEINQKFTAGEHDGRFATAIVMTYLSHRRRLLLTNAGHPRPLFYRQATRQWEFLSEEPSEAHATDKDTIANLPLGIIETTAYTECSLAVDEGDMLILYTDAFSEAMAADGTLLGEAGLVRLVESIPVELSCDRFGKRLREAVELYATAGGTDDETLIVLRFGKGRRAPGIVERLRGYAAVLYGEPVAQTAPSGLS